MGRTENSTQASKPKNRKARRPAREPANRQAGFVQDVAGKAQFDRQVSSEATKATVPAMRPGDQKPKRKNRNRKQKKSGGPSPHKVELAPRLANWLALVSHPFTAVPCKCPVNYNPVPSFMTSIAHTSFTSVGQNVSSGTTTQISLFGGHGIASELASMDGVAYHARHQLVNTTPYTIGPYSTTNAAAGGVISHGITVGNARAVSNTAQDYPMVYDVILPYTATASESGHSRWKLIGLGVRIQNTTVLANRGGNIVSAQPSSNMDYGTQPTTQNQLSANPSWQLSEAANSGTFELSWIPRPEDLAFWHTITIAEEAANYALNYAGLYIFLNNNTAFTQVYTVQLVWHWELSGTYLAAISSPSVHQPADKNLVEPAMDIARFTMKSASGIMRAATDVAKSMSPLVEKHAGTIMGGVAAARVALAA